MQDKPYRSFRYRLPDSPDGLDGGIFLECTDNPNEAMSFPVKSEAMDYYRQQSIKEPLREDGFVNRPLTAFIACFGTIEQHKKDEMNRKQGLPITDR